MTLQAVKLGSAHQLKTEPYDNDTFVLDGIRRDRALTALVLFEV